MSSEIQIEKDIDMIDLSKIIPYEKNAKKHTPEQIEAVANSIRRFGFNVPLILDPQHVIVAGHCRFEAAKKIGIKSVPCIIKGDLTPKEIRAYRIADNKLNESIWDQEILLYEMSEIDDVELLKLTGVDPSELDGVANGLTDDDAVPPTPEKPKTRRGDVYLMGAHRLMCGDSLGIDDVKRLIDRSTVDVVFTDPPYGINAVKTVKEGLGSTGGAKPFGAVGGGGRTGKNDPFGGVKNMRGRVHGHARNAIIKPNLYAPVIGDDSTETAISAYNLCESLSIPIMIFWGGNYYASSLPDSRCWIVWDKENTGSFADGELAWTNIDAPVRIFRHMWNGLMKASERGESRVHPTQKPVALAVWSLSKFCKESKIVMDLFGGSGSTLIACEKLNKSCVMMEMSPDYCDVIVKRWEDFTGKKATHEKKS